MIDYEKEKRLLQKIENLKHYLSGAHSATNDENAGATFHGAVHTVIELIEWIKND